MKAARQRRHIHEPCARLQLQLLQLRAVLQPLERAQVNAAVEIQHAQLW